MKYGQRTKDVSMVLFLFCAASSSCSAAAWACLASAGGPVWLMLSLSWMAMRVNDRTVNN